MSAAYRHLPWRGISFGLAAALCLSSQDAIIKLLSGDYPIMQIIFVRAAIGCGLALLFIVRTADWTALRPKKPKLAAARIVAILIANFCYYIALTKLDLAVYTCLGLTVFIFAAALSGPVLKEKTSLLDWLAIIGGLCGVLIIINPFSAAAIYLPAAALLLFGALMWALGIVATRALGATMSAKAILLYTNLAVATIAFSVMSWQMPSMRDLLLMFGLGILGTCGQGFNIAAYRNARMSTVMPTQHTMLLWAAFFAWLLWDESPTIRLWLGGALIIGAGLATLRR